MVPYNVNQFVADRAGRDFALTLISLIQGQAVRAAESCAGVVISGICSFEYSSSSPMKIVECAFYISSNWKTEMPLVKVNPGELYKTEPNWHASTDGLLCVEHPLTWRKMILESHDEGGPSWTGVKAGVFLVESTKLLLCRHKLGIKQKMKSWPAAWDYWAHGDAALKQIQN